MRRSSTTLASMALVLSWPATAQTTASPPAATPPPALKTMVSADELARLIAKAKVMRGAGQALVVQPIRGAAPYAVILEYREAATPPIVHEENDAEIFFVVEGSGTMMLGGSLTDPRRVKLSLSPTGEPLPDESDPAKVARSTTLTGTGATGGHVLPVSKGEVIIVPPHAVHWFNAVNGALVMVSFHAVMTTYGK